MFEFFKRRLGGSRLTRRPAKLIGLLAARNEARLVPFCLRALAVYTDAIVFLDDCSDDGTPQVVDSLSQECQVARLIRKSTWHRDEPGDRNALLKAGRELGGTHFVSIDADEAFTANCARQDFLRNRILALRAGDQLALNWINLWRSTRQYRCDDSAWTPRRKLVAFCDDGLAGYRSDFIHTSRIPRDLRGKSRTISGLEHGLLHFQFVNWQNLLVKQAWYRCLERVRTPEKPIQAINEKYAPSKDETHIGLQPCPAAWTDGYPFFDGECFLVPETWRREQVLGWFREFGRDYFAGLDIWDIDWDAS